MNRNRVLSGSSRLGFVAALALAPALGGCDLHPDQPGEGATRPGEETAAVAAAAVTAAAPARVPVHVSVPLRSGFARLPKSLHPYAKPELDAGRVEGDRRIDNLSMFFKLSSDQRTERDALVAAQVDPKSPSYRQWLTPEQYAARFGADPADLSRASAWLRSQGLDVFHTSRLGTRVQFGGKVSDLEAAFQTEFHYFMVNGEQHYAMAVAPALPQPLADVVLGLHNTHDFYPHPISGALNQIRKAKQTNPRYDLTFDAGPDAGPDAGSIDLLGPPDWAAAYDVARLYSPGIGGTKLDGTGITIGIVGTAEIAPSDINAFRTKFGLTPFTTTTGGTGPTFTMTLVPNTGAAGAGRFGNGIEAILDTEWSGGIARGASVNFVYVGSTDRDVDDATFYLIEENLTPVVSESFGGCEEGSLPSDADVLEENGTAANLLGITYMAAAGDDGAEDCGGGPGGNALYVDMPGSFPGVTSVGGTQFPPPVGWSAMGNLTAYPPLEAVWNESNDPYSMFGIASGGGGISSVFPRPDYQGSVKTCIPVGNLPFPAANASKMRQVPDLALSASVETPGIFIECTFNSTGSDCSSTGGAPQGLPIGGTSASSPSFAGVVAILNQAVGTRLGNINPLLYALNAAQLADSPFHDITSGNNEIACGPGGVTGDAGGPGDAGWPPEAGCGTGGLNGFAAIAGYDCASGIGSIDGYNLVSALINVSKTTTALAASPIETTEGGMVTLTATVATVGANANTIGGDVTFMFESYTPTGATDLSWELGTVALMPGTGGMGTATLTTAIPVGLVKPGAQWVDVVAAYGGDTAHLPSVSPKVGVGFQNVTFAISPSTAMLMPEGMLTFTSSGGVPPVKWYVDADTTHGRSEAGFGAANIDEMKGILTVGPKAGYVEIAALDSDGAEALAYITVGAPTATPPWDPDAGPFIDGGVPPVGFVGPDSGIPTPGPDASPGMPEASTPDAATAPPADAGKESSSSPSSGCSCRLAGGGAGSDGGPLGALGGIALAVGLVARRRRTTI
jgi:hypothetical protein